MATVTRRNPLEDPTHPKRTRSFAINLITDSTHAAVGAFRKTKPDALTRTNTTTTITRPVLLPIHTNIRPIRRLPRMPSAVLNRLGSASTRSASYSTGSQSPVVVDNADDSASKKRKRGGNENVESCGVAGSRGKSSLKRSKSAYATFANDMDVDDFGISPRQSNSQRRAQLVEEDVDEDTELEDDAVDSSDDHYLSSAPAWQLQKLRKEDLIRLYTVANLATAEDEELTKTEIVNAIVKARKRAKTSTSPRTARSPSSSQTDGNDGGAEESDALTDENERKPARKVRRSATTHAQLGLGHPTARLTKSRSMHFKSDKRTSPTEDVVNRRARFASELKSPETRRRSTNRSSPSSPGPSNEANDVFSSSRNLASLRPTRARQASRSALAADHKGKGKHVGFSDDAAETTEEDEAKQSSDDWVDETTPTKRKSTATDVEATPTTMKRTTTTRRISQEATALARSASKRSIFSPKKLRPRGSRSMLLNSVTNLSHVAEAGSPAGPSLKRSSSRRAWSRKAKRGESMREPNSSDDSKDFAHDAPTPDADAAEEEEDVDPEDQDEDVQLQTAEEDDTDPEADGENVDELMDDVEPAPQSTAVPAPLQDPEESDLTELSDEEELSEDEGQAAAEEEEEEDDNFGSQAEESPEPEETPKLKRTRSSRHVIAEPTTSTSSRRRSARSKGSSKGSVKATVTTKEDEEVGEEEDELEDDQDAEPIEVDEEPAASDEESAVELEVEVEPRVLRNGKVVGANDEEEEEEDAVAEEEEEDQIDESDSVASAIEEDEDEEVVEEVEDDDDDMEEGFDLSDATAKSLNRLRRDDLVKLCETRDLEAEGTKVQLVNNLLEWRDEQAGAPSSSTQPSSNASTVRAPSTYRSPVLMRSDRIHVNQPRTPDPDPDAQSVHLIGSKGRADKEREPDELELDLESLGLEDKEIPADKLTKLEKIGSGGFKDVYIGKYKGRKVAIAEFRGHLGPMDIKELKLLADFNHPNVVRFLGVSIPENSRETPVMMISELCTNGDLFDYVRNVPPPPLRKVLNLMLDIARGIDYLHNIHKPSVIHRDCKSSNILITNKVTAKIADFGLAKVKQSTRSMVKSLVGTVNWQAPELWHAHPKYDHKVDVFSLAMVFWEILQWHSPSKKYPWEGMNEHAIYEEVGAKKHRPSITGLKKLWCPAVVDLVERMWKQDPKERPPIAEVVDDLEAIIADL